MSDIVGAFAARTLLHDVNVRLEVLTAERRGVIRLNDISDDGGVSCELA